MIDLATRTGLASGLVVGLSVAACAPSGHVTPLGRLPHDVQVIFQDSHYPVRGRDEAAISRSIAARGLTSSSGRKIAAFFHWNMESSYTWQPTPEGCVMRDVTIRLTVSTTLPRWERPADAPPELVAAWDRYMRALHLHGEGHRENVARAAREMQRRLLDLEADNCSFIQGDAEALHDRILRRWKQVDMEYEVETENGRTQGAVWPPRG